MTAEYFWTKNTIVNDPVNCTFEELLLKTPDEVVEWIKTMRDRVREVWDATNCPPVMGKDKDELIEMFNAMEGYSTHKFVKQDEITGCDVVVNNSHLGSGVNQFFPDMMKTRIDYGESKTKRATKAGTAQRSGNSVYDYLSDDNLLRTFIKGEQRHLRRDSFYNYSRTLQVGTNNAQTGADWVRIFHKSAGLFPGQNFWLCDVEQKADKNTGYIQQDLNKILFLKKEEVLSLLAEKVLLPRHVTNIADLNNMHDDHQYQIRLYDTNTRIFPLGFQSFKIGYTQVAVNFPPMTAKWIWEFMLKHVEQKRITIYDPSAGWGGRLAGAMSINDRNGDRHIHYVGNDPNPLNFIPELGKTRYEYLAEFIHAHRPARLFKHDHTYEIFQEGSEYIGDLPEFQKYQEEGFDAIFTSPPYFNREAYSDDDKQSCVKFGSSYDSWRDGFLRPTLETCVEYLKHKRYLVWNIADLQTESGNTFPLAQDSIDILKSLGMKIKDPIMMALNNMPGSGRIDPATGLPTCKHYVKLNGKFVKVEPIIVAWKP